MGERRNRWKSRRKRKRGRRRRWRRWRKGRRRRRWRRGESGRMSGRVSEAVYSSQQQLTHHLYFS